MTDPRVEAGQHFCPPGFIRILPQNATLEIFIRSGDIISVQEKFSNHPYVHITAAGSLEIDTNMPIQDILLAIGDAEAPQENVNHATSRELLAELKKHLGSGE